MEVDILLQKLEYGLSASPVSSEKFLDSEHSSFGKSYYSHGVVIVHTELVW